MKPTNLPTVLIATPVKQARQHLPTYFNLLRGLRYPHQLLSVAFLESDSTDGTFEYLAHEAEKLKGDFRRAQVMKHNFDFQIKGPRYELHVQRQRRSIIAKSRNRLIQSALRDEDWVLWIDADLASYPPDILDTLLATGKDIVVPNCVNSTGRTFDLNTFKIKDGYEKFDWSAYVVDGIIQPPKGLGRTYLDELYTHEIIPVDAVGGTMLLIKADLHREGLIFPSYSHKFYIETEGLAVMAKDMGYQCWGLPRVTIQHN